MYVGKYSYFIGIFIGTYDIPMNTNNFIYI